MSLEIPSILAFFSRERKKRFPLFGRSFDSILCPFMCNYTRTAGVERERERERGGAAQTNTWEMSFTNGHVFIRARACKSDV